MPVSTLTATLERNLPSGLIVSETSAMDHAPPFEKRTWGARRISPRVLRATSSAALSWPSPRTLDIVNDQDPSANTRCRQKVVSAAR